VFCIALQHGNIRVVSLFLDIVGIAVSCGSRLEYIFIFIFIRKRSYIGVHIFFHFI
jgi:hypothetical protein